MKPKRIQRKRTKGWRMPANTVYVGRPGKWGNPYKTHWNGVQLITPEEAVELYAERTAPTVDFEPVRGKNVCCWCAPGDPCHGDVILKRGERGTNPLNLSPRLCMLVSPLLLWFSGQEIVVFSWPFFLGRHPDQTFPVHLHHSGNSHTPTLNVHSRVSSYRRRLIPTEPPTGVGHVSVADPFVAGRAPAISLEPHLTMPNLGQAAYGFRGLVPGDPAKVVPTRLVFLPQ